MTQPSRTVQVLVLEQTHLQSADHDSLSSEGSGYSDYEGDYR